MGVRDVRPPAWLARVAIARQAVGMLSRRTALAAAFAGLLALGAPSVSHADDTSADARVSEALMSGLAQHATRFEEMKKRGAFTFSGRMEELDGDGKATDTKDIVVRSTPTGKPKDRVNVVIKCTDRCSTRLTRSEPAVRFPHWSAPPVCSVQP